MAATVAEATGTAAEAATAAEGTATATAVEAAITVAGVTAAEAAATAAAAAVASALGQAVVAGVAAADAEAEGGAGGAAVSFGAVRKTKLRLVRPSWSLRPEALQHCYLAVILNLGTPVVTPGEPCAGVRDGMGAFAFIGYTELLP